MAISVQDAAVRRLRHYLIYFSGQIEGIRSYRPALADALQHTHDELLKAVDSLSGEVSDRQQSPETR